MKKVFGYILAFTAVICMTFGGVLWLEHKPIQRSTLDNFPGVIMAVQDDSLEQYAPLWQKEIARRFPTKTVGILCHGGDFIEGQFVVKVANGDHSIMTAQDLVHHYQKLYPGYQLVLLACNTHALKLGIPGVYYSHSETWCAPDRAIEENPENEFLTLDKKLDGDTSVSHKSRWELYPNVTGNIYEMVSDSE